MEKNRGGRPSQSIKGDQRLSAGVGEDELQRPRAVHARASYGGHERARARVSRAAVCLSLAAAAGGAPPACLQCVSCLQRERERERKKDKERGERR
jgi:hypothetical protein